MPNKNRQTITTPEGFEAYINASATIVPADRVRVDDRTFDVDEKFQAVLTEVLRKDFPETFGRIADYRGPTKQVLPIKLGVVQDVLLKDALLPEFVGGALEEASFPILRKERFFVEDSTIALNARAKRVDATITWGKVTVEAHALEAAAERREQAAAEEGASIDILAYKTGIVDDKLALEEEVDAMTFMTDAANYTTATNVKSIGAGEYFGDYSTPSDPVGLLLDYRETLRTTGRLTGTQMQNLIFWMGSGVFEKLSRHPKIVAIASIALFGAGTGRLDIPVDEAFLSTLLRMNIAVGRAGRSLIPDGPITDVWGKVAGILFTGGSDVIAGRFGLGVTAEGYPSVLEWFDPSVGTKGGDVVKVADAWHFASTNKDGGILFTTPIQ